MAAMTSFTQQSAATWWMDTQRLRTTERLCSSVRQFLIC